MASVPVLSSHVYKLPFHKHRSDNSMPRPLAFSEDVTSMFTAGISKENLPLALSYNRKPYKDKGGGGGARGAGEVRCIHVCMY